MADLTGSQGQQISEVQIARYPAGTKGANQFNASNTGAAAAITAQISGAVGQYTYIEGFQVGGLGATAASRIAITITGLAGGTQTFYLEIPAGATVVVTPLIVVFNRPLVSSSLAGNITVNVPSFGAGNTDAFVSAWGYLQ